MYSTKKTVSKFSKLLKLALFLGCGGVLSFFMSFDSQDGIFQNIGGALHSLFMIGSAVIVYVLSGKQIKQIRGHYFDIQTKGIEIKDSSKVLFLPIHDLISVHKGIEDLIISKTNGDKITIDLRNYKLTYEESKELDQDIKELIKNFS